MNIIGKNIKSLRQKNGWSQGEVAKRLKISIPAFSKLETGLTDINYSRMLQISELFEINVIDLLSPEGQYSNDESYKKIRDLDAEIENIRAEMLILQKKLITLHEENRELSKLAR
jgi:transcriptional regulator with XRE-family HTH domain